VRSISTTAELHFFGGDRTFVAANHRSGSLWKGPGTEGSNLLPSSGESIANLFELKDVGPAINPSYVARWEQ